ncbi:MAG: hypothetical protein ACR2OI_01680 [Acidimicrobiia bacterium]
MIEEHYARLVSDTFAGRKWILPVDVAAAATRSVEWLKTLGAPEPFVISGSRGTGVMPDVPDENLVVLGISDPTMMGAIHSFYSAIHGALPADVQAKLDAWDPEGRARVLASFLDVDQPVGGRSQFGARPPTWLELEDKTVIDALWDEIDVARAPSELIAPEVDRMTRALSEFDQGRGIVLAADNRDGWHGGAEATRVVEEPGDIPAAVAFFASRSDLVRVMPYLEGIPCSIHGLVFPDHVLTVRPVEMMVLYDRERRRFRYGSVSGFWDPRPDDAEYMRDVARRLGAHLRESIGYRGALTIDGVMTRDGFRPTELNPRPGAGLFIVARAAPPPIAVHRMLVAGLAMEWHPEELERHWRSSTTESRTARGLTTVSLTVTGTESLSVRYQAGEWQVVDDEDEAHGTLERGPAASGGVVRILFEDAAVDAGDPAAPAVAAAFRLADELWNTGLGRLEAATDVRP